MVCANVAPRNADCADAGDDARKSRTAEIAADRPRNVMLALVVTSRR
jgi:hypothetical protein